jgi:hypothetical protein
VSPTALNGRVQNQSQIPYLTLSPEAQASVQSRAKERGRLNDRTLMGGDGNATGFTGEELVRAYVPGLIQDATNRNYDFMLPWVNPGKRDDADVEVVTGLNFTFDVKSRRIKVPPRLGFDCKIPAYQVKRQRAEAYIFTAPHENMTGGWLLGWIWKEDFIKEGSFQKKGWRHPSGIILKEDHYFITVDKLFPMDGLVQMARQLQASNAA